MTSFPITISYKGPFGMLIDFALLTTACCIAAYGLYFTFSKIFFKENDLHREITLKLTMLWMLLVLLILLNLLLGMLFYFTGWENLNFDAPVTYLALLPFLLVYGGVALIFWLIYTKLSTKPI